MYSGGRYCEKLLKSATDTPKTNNDWNPADTTLPPPILWHHLHLVDPVIFHLKTLIVPLHWVIAKTKFAEVVIWSRVFIDLVFGHCLLDPFYVDWKEKLNLSVNVFSTKLLIGNTIFTSLTGDGTAILSGQPSHANVWPLVVQGKYLHFSVILIPWVLVWPPVTEPTISRTAVMRSKPTKIILPRLICFNICF